LALEYGNLVYMREIVQIDQAGRLVLPKEMRDRLRIQGGDRLAIELRGNLIELRPEKGVRLERVNGVLVLAGTGTVRQPELAEELREERLDDLSGWAKGKE
jgi:AbrB family looped-hinge helix DNA binding protein